MKQLAFLLAVLSLARCDDVRQCAYACNDAGQKMVKWSQADGCVCDTPPTATVSR